MNTPETSPRLPARLLPRKMLLIGGLLLVLGLLGAGYFVTTLATSATPASEPEPLAVAPSPLAVLDEALMHERERVTHLETKLAELSDRLAAVDGAVTGTQRDVVELQKRHDREASERASARAASVRQRQARRPEAPPAPSAAVLSVDMWGGQPSVAILDPQGRVSFAGQGDRIPGGGVIGAARVSGQTVTVHGDDGSVSTFMGRDK